MESLAARCRESTPSGRVAIFAALERELAALRGLTAVEQRWTEGPLRAMTGRLRGVPIVLAATGDGAESAARGAALLLDRCHVESVVIVGVAGALSPHLEPGRVLAAREVLEGGRPAPPPDTAWLHRAIRDTGATPATFLSSRELLCTVRAKAEAYARLPEGVAAVDLETAAFARAASRRGLPYVALRAISDAAEEPLPLDFNLLRDARGSVDARRVALAALRRPSVIPSLWRLRQRLALCAENLAHTVGALLAESPS